MSGSVLCKTFVYVVFLFYSSALRAQVSFYQPPYYAGWGNLFTADFNGDGKPDLLSSVGTMQLGNGDGTFVNGTNVNGTPLAVADFNGDGKADILEQGNGTLLVLLGNGDGTFQAPISTASGADLISLTAIDLNGDGKADVVGIYNNEVVVYLSNGDGTFKAGIVNSIDTGLFATISFGDFNGDGKIDIVVQTTLDNAVGPLYAFLGNGDGTFQATVRKSTGVFVVFGPYQGANAGSYIAVGDFNGDGKQDLEIVSPGCTATNCGSAIAAGVYSVAGNGDGTFQTPKLVLPNIVGSMITADLNGDGKPDLIVQDNLSTGQIYFGSGDGTFSAPDIYLLSLPSYVEMPYVAGLVTADFNGDGKLDIAIGNIDLLGNGDGTFQDMPLSVIPNYAGSGSKDDHAAGRHSPLPGSMGKHASAKALNPGRGGSGKHATANVLGQFDKRKSVPGAAVGSSYQTGTTTYYILDVFTNDGTGLLSLAHTYALQEPGSYIVAADFNGDGNLDLLVLGVDPLSQLLTYTVLLGNGDGSLQPPLPYTQLTGAFSYSSVIAADFNNDKIPDVVIGGLGYESLAVLIGKGDGTFAAPAYFYDGGDSALSVADFNGDGKMDIAAGVSITPDTAILLGNGDGTFQAAVFPANLNGFAANFTVDLRNDGKADLIGGIGVALGNGDGTFADPTPLPAPAMLFWETSGITSGDFNGDGLPDLFVSETTGPESSQTGILLGNGDGTFNPTVFPVPQTLPLSLGSNVPGPVMIADMNGDGRPDIAFYADGVKGIGVLLNTSPVNFGISATTLSPGMVVAGSSASATISFTRNFDATAVISLTCSGLPSGATCTFTPSPVPANANASSLVIATTASTVAGTYPVVVQATSGSLSQQAALSLVVQPVPDFSVTPPATISQSVTAGQSAMFSLSFSPVGTFTGTVSLSCGITPVATPPATCAFSAPTVELSGTAAQTVTVTVGTTAPVTTTSMRGVSHGGLPLASIPVAGLLGWLLTRKRRRIAMRAALLVMAALTPWAGCGSGGSSTPPITKTTPGTPAGTYTATVTATSGSLSHTTALQVIVQ